MTRMMVYYQRAISNREYFRLKIHKTIYIGQEKIKCSKYGGLKLTREGIKSKKRK